MPNRQIPVKPILTYRQILRLSHCVKLDGRAKKIPDTRRDRLSAEASYLDRCSIKGTSSSPSRKTRMSMASGLKCTMYLRPDDDAILMRFAGIAISSKSAPICFAPMNCCHLPAAQSKTHVSPEANDCQLPSSSSAPFFSSYAKAGKLKCNPKSNADAQI